MTGMVAKALVAAYAKETSQNALLLTQKRLVRTTQKPDQERTIKIVDIVGWPGDFFLSKS